MPADTWCSPATTVLRLKCLDKEKWREENDWERWKQYVWSSSTLDYTQDQPRGAWYPSACVSCISPTTWIQAATCNILPLALFTCDLILNASYILLQSHCCKRSLSSNWSIAVFVFPLSSVLSNPFTSHLGHIILAATMCSQCFYFLTSNNTFVSTGISYCPM